jgi:hypothetical protein
MRLTDTFNKIKVSVPYWQDLPKDLFIIAFILLTALGSFMLGRLSFLDEKHKNDLKIIRAEPISKETAAIIGSTDRGVVIPVTSSGSQAGMYVGSRSGKTYYLPWCSGVKRIHEENKIWFKDKADAINKGYKPSGTCKGI